MSWSFTSIGKASDVKAEINAMPDFVPQPIKDLVALFADARESDKQPRNGLRVEACGHLGVVGSYVDKLKIEPIILCASVPVEVPPQPAYPTPANTSTTDGAQVAPIETRTNH